MPTSCGLEGLEKMMEAYDANLVQPIRAFEPLCDRKAAMSAALAAWEGHEAERREREMRGFSDDDLAEMQMTWDAKNDKSPG